MKKRIFSMILLATLVLSVAGCQSSAGSPVDTVNKFVDSVFYMTDSDTAYNNLGMDSTATRALLISVAEYDLQAMFFPTGEEAEYDEEGNLIIPVEEADEAESEEEAVEEAVVIDENVTALARKVMEIMQGVVKYKTKMMTLSDTTASVKLSVYPYDIDSFYTEYINQIMAIPYPEDEEAELTEEVMAEYTRQEIEAYSKALEGVGTSAAAYDMYIDLYKADGNWYLNNVETVFYDLYYLFTGTYY